MLENLFQNPEREKDQSKSYLSIPVIKQGIYGTPTRVPNNLVKGKICPSKLLSEEFRFSHVLFLLLFNPSRNFPSNYQGQQTKER